MGLMVLWPTPEEPHLTKSVTKNKRIDAWQKYKIWTGFEPGMPGQKANIITTEQKRNVIARYCL